MPILFLTVGLILLTAGIVGFTYGFVYGWKSLNDGWHALVGSWSAIALMWAFWMFLIPYVKLSVMGCYFYDYIDLENNSHVHLDRPAIYGPGESGGYVQLIKGPLFQINVGGWFKRCHIYYQSGHYWRIRQARGFGYDNSFVLIDPDGGNLPPMLLVDLRWVIQCFGGLRSLVSFSRQVEQQRDHLGRIASSTIAFALRSKSAQKSPTARTMRAMLENGLRDVPAHPYGGRTCAEDLPALWQRSATETPSSNELVVN